MGRHALGVGPISRHHEDVAVLHAGMELDAVAAELGLQGTDHLGRGVGVGVAPGEVEHGAGSPTVTRLQR